MAWLRPDTLATLGRLSHAQFLKRHWQRTPLFVKNAVPEIAGLLDGNDLAGLALEDDVESRIVTRRGRPDQARSWSLRRGPFTAADFSALPDRDWTLLVQAVDHRLPELAELLDRLAFLPQWRIDDVMVSYAVDGGGVGPHYDSYDVFLIQGSGTRVWKVGPPVDDTDLLSHPDLRILRRMEVLDEYLCEPGDLLYLPPGVAHWGTAQGECMTFSVGFRAPADRELLDGFCNHLLERIPEGQRYADAGLAAVIHPGELPARTVQAFRRRLAALLDTPGALDDFLGRAFSEPKYAGQCAPQPERRLTAAGLRKALSRAAGVRRNEGSRFLLLADGTPALYVDGERIGLTPDLLPLATRLADRRLHRPADLLAALDAQAGAGDLLLRLLNAGQLYLQELS